MIADRYEEMIKRLKMEQLKPQFPSDTSAELSDGREASIEQVVPEEPTPEPMIEQPTPFPQDRDLTGAIGDMAVAAGPSLQNLLFGGSYAEQAGRTAQANKYLQNRGVAHAAEIKDLKSVVGADGKPEYLRASLAEGREPYNAIKNRTADGGAAKSFMTFDVLRPETGERFNVMFNNRIGKYTDANGTPVNINPTDVIKPVADKLVKTTDAYGNESVDAYNQYGAKPTSRPNPKISTVKTNKGYGGMQGIPTEGLKQTEKSLDEHNKRVGDIELKRNDLQSSLEIMSKPDATPTELTAARESLIRSISTEPRLTDEDVARAMGNDFRSIFAQTRNAIQNKAFGDMSPIQRQEFIQSAKTLIKKMDQGIEKSYNKMLEESATVPGGKEYLEKKTPSQTGKSKAKQAELISIKEKAKKFFGKNTDAYNKFIAKKQEDLGL